MAKSRKKVKKGWSLLRVLEVLAVVGSVAAVAIKVFQGKKKGK